MISLPRTARPETRGPIALPLGDVVRIAFAPPTLQNGSDILDFGIDIDAAPNLFRKLFLISPAAECNRMKSHVPCELDTHMPEAADALHCDQVSAAQAGVTCSALYVVTPAQSSGAAPHGTEFSEMEANSMRFGDSSLPHILHLRSLPKPLGSAIHHIPTPAWCAHTILAGYQAGHPRVGPIFHRVTPLPKASMRPTTSCLRNAGRVRPRVNPMIVAVGVTDSAGFYANPHLTRSGSPDWAFHHPEACRVRTLPLLCMNS